MTETTNPPPTFLEQWLANVAGELNDLGRQGAFSRSWLTNGNWNKQSWLHSRIFGLMARAVERPLIPHIEVRWHQAFKADLTVDYRDQVISIIEYESTNSSDERLMAKDVTHYEKAIQFYIGYEEHSGEPYWKLPEWWIIVSTLPNDPVKDWPWWPYYNEDMDYPPAIKSKAKRDKNPLKYYEAGLHKYFKDSWKRICQGFGHEPPCRLVWVNLGLDALEVKNINGKKPDLPIRFALELPEG